MRNAQMMPEKPIADRMARECRRLARKLWRLLEECECAQERGEDVRPFKGELDAAWHLVAQVRDDANDIRSKRPETSR